MQVEHITTTAFHPQANGMVEHLHRQIKDVLHARGAAAWVDHLPWVILGLCAAPKDDSGVSAPEATLGQSLMIPGQPKTPEGAPFQPHYMRPRRSSHQLGAHTQKCWLLLPFWILQRGSKCGRGPLQTSTVLGPLSRAVLQGSAQTSQGSSRSTSGYPVWSWAPSGCGSW